MSSVGATRASAAGALGSFDHHARGFGGDLLWLGLLGAASWAVLVSVSIAVSIACGGERQVAFAASCFFAPSGVTSKSRRKACARRADDARDAGTAG